MKSEFEDFDRSIRKLLSVSREELRRREKEWKEARKRVKKKRAKTSPASHVSSGKD
jgi:hypothetical protein